MSIACIRPWQLIAIAAFTFSTARGQVASTSANAWLGIAPPSGLSDPHRPIVDVRTAKPAAAALPTGESHRQLRGERIHRDVATIVDFSKRSRAAGNKVWGRVTGFPSLRATVEWTARQFSTAKLTDVHVQEYDAAANTAMWWATDWEVRVLADERFGAHTQDVILASAVPTSGSQIADGPLSGELVHVGVVSEALPNVDVKGKIAVQTLQPAGGAYSERTRTVERAQELSKRGALAVLNVVRQTGNMHVRDFGQNRQDVGGAPCFNLGTADGAFLETLLARTSQTHPALPVRVQLKLKAERLTGLKGYNAVAIVPGKSEENIIVNAHADGWYDAAGDNADGLAVLVALARHFASAQEKPERTLVFVASGGHHSTGLNGPSNFVRMNANLTSKTVLVLNLEHIAQLRIRSDNWTAADEEQPMNFGVDNAAPAIYSLAKQGVERYGFKLNANFGTSVAGDLGGYGPLGVARVQAIHSGPLYHTSGDVLETISIPGLERAAHFYAFFIEQTAKTARDALNPAKR